MTTLMLIRHGQTDWNLDGRYQGQADIPLNAVGLLQAEALAERLDGQSFAALYSSDLARARQTAEILARRLGLAVITDRRLREIDQGEWQGRTLNEVQAIYESFRVVQSAEIDPATARAPGGESVLEVAQRVALAADDIARSNPNGLPVLVVGHGLALATLYCQALCLPLAGVYSFIPQNTQATPVEWQVNS